jgi:protein-S-isoprenylcysteine O-methyltransferase Ste14
VPRRFESRALLWLSQRRIDAAWLGLAAIPFAHPTTESILLFLPLPLAGLLLRTWARGHLDKSHIYLTQAGPYAFLRHPLYVASFLLGLGLCAMTRIAVLPFAFGALFLALYIPKGMREEAFLSQRYDGEFERYASRVAAVWPRRHAAPTSEFLTATQRFQWKRVVRSGEWKTWLVTAAVLAVLSFQVGR